MPSTSGRKVHFANDGGKEAWDALGKEMHAAFVTMEWPPKPRAGPSGAGHLTRTLLATPRPKAAGVAANMQLFPTLWWA